MDAQFETTSITFDSATGVGTLTLERPDVLNAINDQLRADIIRGLEALESVNDESNGIALRAVVLEGGAGEFCTGADINELSARTPGESSGRLPYRFIRELPVPVIAKVRGHCLGGGFELALSCDFRLAHEDARFGFPEVDIGQIPGVGGVQLLSELVNPAVAREIAMTGEYLSADRVHDLHIVNRVYGSEFDDAVEEFAEQIASKPPLAIQAIKRSASVAASTGLEEGIDYDWQQFQRLFATEDHEQGVRAFADDDYEPTFKGK